MSCFSGPEIITNGLVLSLDAGNTKSYPGSGTTWTDLSTNKKTHTLVNGPVYSSSFGGMISFDSTDDYGITSDIQEISGTKYTASIWIRLDSTTSGVDTRFFWHGNYGILIYKATDNIFRFYALTDSGGSAVQPSFGALSLNTWLNLTGTYDGSYAKVYVNGQYVTQLAQTGNLQAATLPNRFLLGSGIADFWTKCDIAQVSIYNTTLSAAEIQQNFNALRGRFGI